MTRLVTKLGSHTAPSFWACLIVFLTALSAAGAERPGGGLSVPQERRPFALSVPADCGWIETGIYVSAGEAITVEAEGRILHRQLARGDLPHAASVGPNGTYFYEDAALTRAFPLPAADCGPAPCYCLIGKIGEGAPFYVGARRSWFAHESGPLLLGINDFDLSDNSGQLQVIITKTAAAQPIAVRRHVSADSPVGASLPGCSVVVFYVDGLRADVVQEMAAMGHLPNLRRWFLDRGAWLPNAVTAFPSNTITSNGTFWTGRYPDRHGIKSQTRFSRRELKAVPHLDPLGPSRTSQILSPHGLDRVGFELRAAGVRATRGKHEADAWRRSQTTSTPAIYDYLRRSGVDWASGLLPVTPETPPGMWSRYLSNEVPLLGMHEAIYNMDASNARYAIEQQLRTEEAVTIVWLPDVDTHSHHRPRGQFGHSRRTIARVDRLIGQCIEKLCRTNRLDRTYLMLISDHGHVGGRWQRLARYDLAHEFFYQPRLMGRDGRWIGGGLGMSVRQHREFHRHDGDSRSEFVFLEAYATGAARVFLPKGSYRSGRWSPPNTFGELVRYRVDDHLPPVNLVERLTHANAGTDSCPQFPVDLVLAKLNDRAVVVASGQRGWAVIQRRPVPEGGYVYRYQVLKDYQVGSDGSVTWQVDPEPQSDPLRLLEVVSAEFLADFHDEQTWLELTVHGEYPDSVVALSRHMLWDSAIRARECEYAPDLVVTAARGWQFGTHNEPGTGHGHPLRETMLMTWMVSGPNIRSGAVIEPACRSVDLLPTILEMAGVPFRPCEMDGRPLRRIYEAGPVFEAPLAERPATQHVRQARWANQAARPRPSLYASTWQSEAEFGTLEPGVSFRPVFWEDCDLEAWQPLPYEPRPEYPHDWVDVHRFDDPCDLHNVFHNLASISEQEFIRLTDDAAGLFGCTKPVGRCFDHLGPALDRLGRKGAAGRALAEGIDALQLRHVALGDYSYTSSGNWQRGNLVIDWAQSRLGELDHGLAATVGLPSVVGAPFLNGGVDCVQGAANEVHRVAGRLTIWLIGEKLINNLEDGIGAVRNWNKRTPAEIVIDP